MTDPFRNYGSPSNPTGFGSTRPYGYTPADLMDPMTAQALVRPLSYAQTYGPPSLSSLPALPAPKPPAADLYENIGKTQLSLVGQPSAVAGPGELTRMQQEGIDPYAPPAPPQMGALEALLRGVLDQVGGFMPADIRAHVGNGLGLVSNLLDIPLEFIGNQAQVPLPQLAGAPGHDPFANKQQFFESLPETEEKKKAREAMERDPVNALFYMSQYFQFNETEIAHGLGVSPLVSDYFVPSNNLGDQIMRTLGLLGLPGRLTSRAFAESGQRNVEQTILQAPIDSLNPELQRIRAEYEAGNLTRTELYDTITRSGFAFSNNIYDNMLWEMVTDPLLVASLGSGLALKAASTSGRMAMINKAVSAAYKGLDATQLGEMKAFGLGRIMDDYAARGMSMGADDAQRLVKPAHEFEWLQKFAPQYEQDALASMGARGRAMVALDPLIKGAAEVSRVLNSPFDLWGHVTNRGFKNGQRIAEFSSGASVEGMFQAYGPSRIQQMQQLFEGIGVPDQLKEIFGRMGANLEVAVSKDGLSRMATEAKSVPYAVPDQIIRAQSEVYHSRLALQVEGYMRRVMTQFLPTSRFGKEAAEETMEKQRAVARLQLEDIMGPAADAEKIAAFVKNADNEMLALIEHMRYGGPVVKKFISARTLARGAKSDKMVALRQKLATGGKGGTPMSSPVRIERIEKKIAALEGAEELWGRATLVGPKLLTDVDSKRIRRQLARGNISAAREAVEQFEVLFNNFAAKGLDDEELVRNLDTFLQELEKSGGLTRLVKRDELPPELREWFDNEKAFADRAGIEAQYRVGISPAPDKRWQVVRDAEGNVVGVNAWADAVPDVADVRSINSLSVIRDKLFRPIRGERHLEESRRDFRRRAVEDYGLARSEANALFGAIRRRAGQADTMPRGLKESELQDLLSEMNFDEATKQRVGQRGMARLVASAFEGDTFTVGITQKISGRMKAVGANKAGNNWLGIVSERLYPMARFQYNPIFLMQEAAEPFFWNILRGVRPGMKWSKDDLKSFEALRRAGFLGEWADQWEYTPAALGLLGATEAHRVAGAGSQIGREWGNKLLGEGRKVRSLAELKRLNYVRQHSKSFGEAFRAYVDDLNPNLWAEWTRAAGSTDPTRVGNWYWLNKAFNTPESEMADMQKLLMDANLPREMGESAKQMPLALARHHNFLDFDSLRTAVRKGEYTEEQFRKNMKDIAEDVYADRAWAMASHIGPKKFWEKSADAYAMARGNTREAKREAGAVMSAMRRTMREFSDVLGYTEEEYLSRFMSRPMKYLDSSSKLRGLGYHYQLVDEEAVFQFYGKVLKSASSDEVRRISREARAVSGSLNHNEAEMQRLIEEASQPVANAVTPAARPSIVKKFDVEEETTPGAYHGNDTVIHALGDDGEELGKLRLKRNADGSIADIEPFVSKFGEGVGSDLYAEAERLGHGIEAISDRNAFEGNQMLGGQKFWRARKLRQGHSEEAIDRFLKNGVWDDAAAPPASEFAGMTPMPVSSTGKQYRQPRYLMDTMPEDGLPMTGVYRNVHGTGGRSFWQLRNREQAAFGRELERKGMMFVATFPDGRLIASPSFGALHAQLARAMKIARSTQGGAFDIRAFKPKRAAEEVPTPRPSPAEPTGQTRRITRAAIDGTSDGNGADLVHIAGPGLNYEDLAEMAETVLGSDQISRIVDGNRNVPALFHLMTEMLPDDVVWRFTRDHIAQPGDIHEHRLRIERLEAQNQLRVQADLLGSEALPGSGAQYIAQNLQPGSGNDYFRRNMAEMVDLQPGVQTGPPNTGVHIFDSNGYGEPVHYFGWYDEQGVLVSTVSVSDTKDLMERGVRAPTTPGGPVETVDTSRMYLEGLNTPSVPMGTPQAARQRLRDWEEAIRQRVRLTTMREDALDQLYRDFPPVRRTDVSDLISERSNDYYNAGSAPVRPFRLRADPTTEFPSLTDAEYARVVETVDKIFEKHPFTPQPPRPTNVTGSALPLVEQGHVNMVGTRMSAHGKGYYSKLVEYIDEEGTFSWADVTGRGSYDLPGSRAAQSWIRKKDKASLAAAREALASRMLAGFSFIAHKNDMDPNAVIRSMQAVLEAGSGKHARAVPDAHLAIEQMLDFARISGDEIVPNWKQRAHLESLLHPKSRQVDTINPSLEGARAHGYFESPKPDNWDEMHPREQKAWQEADEIIARRGGGIAGPANRDLRVGMTEEELLQMIEGDDLPFPSPTPVKQGITPAMFAKMQKDYRQWAGEANANAWGGRTDWTAADIQAVNIARYRTAMKKQDGYGVEQLMNRQAVAINFELEPHPGTDFYEAFPHLAALNANGTMTPEQLMQWNQGLEQVQRDVGRWWASELGEISGVSVVQVSVGEGKHVVNVRRDASFISRKDFADELTAEVGQARKAELINSGDWDEYLDDYIRDNSVDDGQWAAYGPQVSIVVTGSPDSIEAAVAATGGAFQRGEVYASYIDYAQTPGSNYVKNNWDQDWVTDFIVPADVSENMVGKMIDKLWTNDDLVRQHIVMPNGDRAIRVYHEVGVVNERGLEALKPLDDPAILELQSMGVTHQRGVVDMFKHKVDIESANTTNASALQQMYEDAGEFIDDRGTKITRQSAPWEWDTRVQWRTGKLADPWIRHADANYPHVATALRNRHRGQALAVANTAYWQHLGDFVEEWRARDVNLPPPIRGMHYQLTPKGVRGATKINSDLDASIALLPKVGPDTIPHELLHQMVPHFEDSMIVAIQDAYSKATGKRVYHKAAGAKPVLANAQEEWMAEQFVRYVTTGQVDNSRLQSAFNFMGKLVKDHTKVNKLAEAHPEAKSLFDQLFGQANHTLSAVPFNPDEYRILAMARYLMSEAEEQAHTSHYFRRGRSFLERSINHPYLGYYPASYMWGKVVPELLRFLVKQPFGIKAPMAGYMMASHVSQALLLQLNTDPELREFMEKHEKGIRFLQMMVPGTPWDIPVNSPAWLRHTAARQVENADRTRLGFEPKQVDPLGELADTGNYALGALNFINTGQQALKEFEPEEAEQQPVANPSANALAMLEAYGLTPPDQDLAAAEQTLAPMMAQ